MNVEWLAYVASQVSRLGFSAGRQPVTPEADTRRHCESVAFSSEILAPQVQATVNYRGRAASPDDGTAIWFEEVTDDGFRICVEELEGFKSVADTLDVPYDGALVPFNIDWLVYETGSSSLGFIAGELPLTAGFTATSCTLVATGCTGCDNVQLTVNHRGRTEAADASHDTTLVWAEDFTASGDLTVCIRETSAYAGGDHDTHARVGWLVRNED
jgi:hypothetical protein